VPGSSGRGDLGELPLGPPSASASARRVSRYQRAARVLYFSRIGMCLGTPCSAMKSLKRWLPPSSIMRRCTGFQESMLMDWT